MAVNLPRHGTWDPITSNRAPIIGDISTQYDITTDTHRTAVYDGHRWVEMNNSTNTIASSNLTASSINANASASRIIDHQFNEKMFEFLEQNLRVAEYIGSDGKIQTVQLEMRVGPSYVWEPIKRVKTKNTL
jgi:hypothetical protein